MAGRRVRDSNSVSTQTEVNCRMGGLVMQGSPQPRSTNRGADFAMTSSHALCVSRQSETNSHEDLKAKVI